MKDLETMPCEPGVGCAQTSGAPCSGCSSCASAHHRCRLRPALIIAVAGIVFAASLLIGPKLSTAPAAATAPAAGPERLQSPASPTISQPDLLAALVRYGFRPEGASMGDSPQLDVLLATPIYFIQTGRKPPEGAAEQPSIVFYVSESVHMDSLPGLPAEPLLKIGAVYHRPVEVRALTDSPHHRMSVARYRAVWADASPIVGPEDHSLALVFPAEPGSGMSDGVLTWQVPIAYGPSYSSGEVFIGGAGQVSKAHEHPAQASQVEAGGEHHKDAEAVVANLFALEISPLTPVMVLALLGALMVALTPCLVDLGLFYGASYGGMVAGLGATTGGQPRGRVMKNTFSFVLGLGLVYTTGGAAVGYVGELLQRLGIVIEWSRPISVAVGSIMILLAFKVAMDAKAPVACSLPLAGRWSQGRLGAWTPLVQGSAFAAQCFACLNGSIVSALILYAGSTASPVAGASLFLAYSLGIGVVILLGAFAMTSVLPALPDLRRARPFLGLASGLLIASFGVTMILGQEHFLSDLIYRALSLG
ncbi:MAG: hypothetical protein HYX92_03930 [Chloroflexi bacterium]|nr:hypothetical protein [Chloroflexota bacterium]